MTCKQLKTTALLTDRSIVCFVVFSCEFSVFLNGLVSSTVTTHVRELYLFQSAKYTYIHTYIQSDCDDQGSQHYVLV